MADNIYSIKFRIIDSLDNEIWSSDGYLPIQVKDGLFNHYLGSSNPLPGTLGDHGKLRLGIIIGMDSEILTDLSSTSFAFSSLKAQSANAADTAAYSVVSERVIQSRDLYHQIMDINPNSITVVPFVARTANPTVTLYLYGSGYQGPLSYHTHDGINAHSHDISGTVVSSSVSHTHSYSGTSGTTSAAHTHTGSIGDYNLSHSHGYSMGSVDLNHGHSYSMSKSGAHHHNFYFFGVHSGNYLAALGDVLIDNGGYDQVVYGSVSPDSSNHTHPLTINGALGSHNHTLTINNAGGNHSHSLSISSASPSHSHSYSGTTAADNITHSHSFTGSASSTGAGLEAIGVAAGTLPSNIYVYIDGSPVAGPFDGTFASGGLDLSSYITGSGERTIEIREEGGSGGRISYNLFVE
ncbi:MAG: hypothetical protein CVT49_04970 [candidate division Zixibacteria bacterium HGW-Zixibacteria-1]|nr:MAG: hypothetical protein CVT49_04970 [candidate division Zixibacteria bacterium HGW-Zixibacteria-1]